MKIIADKTGIKVVGVPLNNTRPNEMLHVVEELMTSSQVIAKGDTLVVKYTNQQKETKND